MTSPSFLDDCQNWLSKGNESWKSYFSKWDVLVKQEENVPEDELLDELDEEVELLKKKKEPNKQPSVKALSLKLSQTNKKTIRRKKNIRTLMKKKKKIKKEKERTQKVIERPSRMDNENLPEDSSNEQIELDLRTIFMDILKANKNKWEVFGVLSQMFSQGGLTVKSSHHLILNQHLEVTPNFGGEREFLFGDLGFSSAPRNTREICARNISFQGFYQNSNQIFENHLGFLSRPRPYLSRDILVDRRFSIDSFGQESVLPPVKIGRQIPIASQVEFSMRLLQSCPSKIFSSSLLNKSEYRRNKMLKPLALDFSNKYTAGERSKINNEYLVRNRYEEAGSLRAADIFREKSFHNLCLHKRTNDVSLNMENSNFITPKRKPPERKCFSENISQRKRRRPSKLAFFGNEEESDDDAATENRSPIIRWHSKKRKTEINPEKIITESDSDECESVFDRINHKA